MSKSLLWCQVDKTPHSQLIQLEVRGGKADYKQPLMLLKTCCKLKHFLIARMPDEFARTEEELGHLASFIAMGCGKVILLR